MQPENKGSLLNGITNGIINCEKFKKSMNFYETSMKKGLLTVNEFEVIARTFSEKVLYE